MRKTKKVYIPATTEIKILDTVKLLNDNGEYPLPLGVYNILLGSPAPEFEKYQDLPTFKTLTSYTSKHISRLIMMLLRNGYLHKIYDEKTNDLYLEITEKVICFFLVIIRNTSINLLKKYQAKSL